MSGVLDDVIAAGDLSQPFDVVGAIGRLAEIDGLSLDELIELLEAVERSTAALDEATA